jgi:tetratricopeptide (TPR) repeat protein
MIAKGESAGAIQYIKETLPAYSGSPVEKALTVRLMLAEFYSGEIDSVVSRKNDLLGLLGINDPLFNDVIEFTGFIEKYQSGGGVSSPEALNDFIKSEQYLRQNKLSEAKEVLNYILINYPSENISIPVRFRLIQIDLFFRQFEQAEQNLDQLLIAENVYADGALFMMGEIAQFRDANPEYAAKWYEIILQRYPNSLYTDTVRKRLRNLQNAQLLRNNL